jgi:type VI secretion system secreted protein VgrG
MAHSLRIILRAVVALGILACATAPLFAMPRLGSASSYGVLARDAIHNSNASVVVGHLGSGTAASVTGFPPGTVTRGTIHEGDAMTLRALSDITIGENGQGGEPCGDNLTGQDLGDRTLSPGVYCVVDSASLNGTLTLDGGNDPEATFLFQLGSTFDAATGSQVVLTNGTLACNVWWVVLDDVKFDTQTIFAGTMISFGDIIAAPGTAVDGRLLAPHGSITMDTAAVEADDCLPILPSPVTPTSWGRLKTLYSH